MNKKPFLFRLRRFFGLTAPELHWIREALPHSPNPVLELLHATATGLITENTYSVCLKFLEGLPLPYEETTHAKQKEKQQEITCALLSWLEN